MLCYERKHIRELGLQRVLKCRNREVEVYEFKVLEVNYNANNYTVPIDWHNNATEVSLAVCGNTFKNGLIRAKISYAKGVPKMETKNRFNELIRVTVKAVYFQPLPRGGF